MPAKYRGKPQGRSVGTNHLNSSVRTREYLTTAEIERLMAAARKSSRYGHRDATMILIGYRHGLRASELCDLQWSQVELATGRLHVRRAKNGSPSVHPMQGDEIRDPGVGVRSGWEDSSTHQSMGGNGLIVSFGEVMPMRRNRLQRQRRRAFWASAAPEVSTSELASWCWARQTLIEKRAPSRWQRESMIRAARSIGAVRTRRIGCSNTGKIS